MAAGQPRHILIGSSPAHGRPSPAGAEPEGLLLRESNASPAAPSGSSPQGTGNSRKSTRLAFSKQALNRLTGRLRRPFPGPPSTRWRGHRPSTRDIPPLASGCSVIPTISWTSWRSYAARSQKRAPGYASPPRRTSPAAHEKTRAGTLRPGGRALRRSPSARGVGRVGGRAKGPPEHLLLDAGALGMDRLHRASWAAAVPDGLDLFRPRACGQTHAGLLVRRVKPARCSD